MKRAIIIFILVVQTILYIGHLMIFRTISYFFIDSTKVDQNVGLIFFFLSFTLIISLLLSSRFDNWLVRLYNKLAVVWLGLVYFLFSASVLIWIISSVGIKNTRLVLAVYILALGGAVYAFVVAKKIEKTRIDIDLENLPAVWKGRKAVWISDLHLGHVRGRKFAEKVARNVNSENPDIVFVGGDVFDGVKDDYLRVVEPLKNIVAPLGTYFVFGNHEEFTKSDVFVVAVENAGMKVLNNEKVEIDGLQIVGVDFHTSHSADSFKETLSKLVDRTKQSIVLKHEPNNLDVAEKAGVGLQISGHTHNAQMWPFNLLARRVYKGYEYGLKRHGSLWQLTSSGVGTWGPPYRLGSRSEIAVLTFK